MRPRRQSEVSDAITYRDWPPLLGELYSCRGDGSAASQANAPIESGMLVKPRSPNIFAKPKIPSPAIRPLPATSINPATHVVTAPQNTPKPRDSRYRAGLRRRWRFALRRCRAVSSDHLHQVPGRIHSQGAGACRASASGEGRNLFATLELKPFWRNQMATNKPVGDNARKGAVRKRSQVRTKIGGANGWTKRNKKSGEFMAVKRPGKKKAAKKFKGVRTEKKRASR